MELKLNSGRLSVPIVRDGKKTGTLTFNPGDLDFVSRFREMIGRYECAIDELRARSAALEEGDDEGYLALLREICERLCSAIDDLFGPGTSDAAFGCIPCTPAPFDEFFAALDALIREYRLTRLSRYLPQEAETGDALV